MTIEFVGAIEIDPPMTRAEAEAVRRLGRLDERAPDTAPTPVSPWWPTPDGRQLLLNRASPPEDCGEWLRYLLAMSGGFAVNYAAYAAVYTFFAPARTWPELAVAAGSVAGLAVNYVSSRWWIYRSEKRVEKAE